MRRLTRVLLLVLLFAVGVQGGVAFQVQQDRAQARFEAGLAATTPEAIVNVSRCGKFLGAFVVTRDGAVHALEGLTSAQAAAIAEKLPPESRAGLNYTDGCDKGSTT